MDPTYAGDARPSAAWPFVEQLVPLAGQLHLIFSHMEAFEASGRSASDAPPVADVLASLLDMVLAPLAARRRADLAVAAEIIAEVARTIEAELYTVDPAIE